MKLHKLWQDMVSEERSEEEHKKHWDEYYALETENYKKILSQKDTVFSGKIKELSAGFGMDDVTFTGFLDGINTSLKTELKLDSLTENSEVKLDVDFEKLYYNMLGAKAPWLYNLPEWDNVLSQDARKAIGKRFRNDHIYRSEPTVGRNDPCPCGSGKKYKKCCGLK